MKADAGAGGGPQRHRRAGPARRHRPRGPAAAGPLAALAGALACLLAVLTWQVVSAGPFTAADLPAHYWVLRHGLDRSSPLWVTLGEIGDGRVTLPVLAVLAAVLWWRRRVLWPLLLAAGGLAASTAVLEVMKAVTGRAAPATGSDAAFAGGGEFPSGHTFAAAVICGLAGWLAALLAGRVRASRYACLAAGGVAGLGAAAAMVRMDYHWISDVAGGWLLGMAALLLVLAAAERAPARMQPSGAWARHKGRRPGRAAHLPETSRPGRSSPGRGH